MEVDHVTGRQENIVLDGRYRVRLGRARGNRRDLRGLVRGGCRRETLTAGPFRGPMPHPASAPPSAPRPGGAFFVGGRRGGAPEISGVGGGWSARVIHD